MEAAGTAQGVKPYYQDSAVTIYHGDCLDIAPLVRCTLGLVVVTDPPYSSGGYNETGSSAPSKGSKNETRMIAGDSMSTEGYVAALRMVLSASQPEAAYVFTDWRMWSHTKQAVEMARLRCRGMLVWDKLWGGMGRRWRTQHELICWGTRLVSEMGAGHGNVLSFGRSENENHPTEKPIDLLVAIIRNAEPGVVFDPFAGSGTTLRAAKDLGRKAIGIEIEERYCEIAARRCAQEVMELR